MERPHDDDEDEEDDIVAEVVSYHSLNGQTNCVH